MKNISMLVWFTQLGLNVVVPLAGAILMTVWLRNRFLIGNWIIWLGIGVGLYLAVNGFINSLKTMDLLAQNKKDSVPPVSFNDHE